MKRVITISFPQTNLSKQAVFDLDQKTLYELVDFATKNLTQFSKGANYFGKYSLSDVMPIHNFSGIRNLNQIKQMQEKIQSGKDILERNNFPNIKLVIAPNSKLLLFDGTHTLIACLLQKKKLLSEVPYLIISAENFKPVLPEELSIFFPRDFRDEVKSNWSNFVVNWQAQTGFQIEKREYQTMGELTLEFSKRYKSTVQK